MHRLTMNTPFLSLVLVFATSGCGTIADTSGPGKDALTAADQEAIRGLAAGYTRWALAGDFDTWSELFHPDAVRMNPGEPPLVGQAAIRRWANELPLVTVRSHSMSPLEVEGTRELAFVRGTYTSELVLAFEDGEVILVDEGSWLSVVRRDVNDAWKFYRFISNPDVRP